MTTSVVVGHDAYPLGWAATGELVVVDQTPSGSRMVNRLRVYDVATGAFTPVTGMELVTPNAGPVWSANRQALAVTLTDGVSAAETRTVPAIVAFDDPFILVVAAWQGHSPALSPDGQRLAYITTQAVGARAADTAAARVEVLDLVTGSTTAAVTLADLPASHPLEQFTALGWSPDGTRLAVVASQGNSDYVYAVQLAEAGANLIDSINTVLVAPTHVQLVGFSADSDFLALANPAGPATRLLVLNLNEPGMPIFEANAASAAWSPSGHHLAISNGAGLFVADPTTGETQWVTGGECVPSWHAP
jgi:Tol biopolymer transport system component